MILQMVGWLTQELVMPLWAFLVALLLPAAFFAKIAKEAIESKLKIK